MWLLLVLAFSFLVLVFALVFFVKRKIQKIKMMACNILSQKSLNDYCSQVLKKRKNSNYGMKNDHYLLKSQQKYSYLQFLLPCISKFEFDEILCETNKLLFPEGVIKKNVSSLFEKGDVCVFSHEKFRSVKGRILILEIAKAYVFLSLNDKTFDMVAHFKNIAIEYKLFKKEIQILPKLVKYFFVFELLNLARDLQSVRIQIERAKELKRWKEFVVHSRASIYSLAKHKPSLLSQFHFSEKFVIDSCVHLSKDLLDALSRCKAIFLWCKVL